MRSLIEPPGFWFSSLRKSSQGPVSSEPTFTSGVLPIRDRTFGSALGVAISLSSLSHVERGIQIGPQILEVLEPDGQAHQPVLDADRLAHLARDGGVCHQRRVLRERLDATQALCEGEPAQRFQKA